MAFERIITTLSQNIRNAKGCGAVSHPRISDTTCCETCSVSFATHTRLTS